ncbi:putative 4-hydroxy-4-methyl-2-oxoglutarate aldolase 3 [Rosa chinensis]|uniref:putative 4-hydroxy-4-methyl-2-oxoglutarate aldolase 3 n=1 Tax=Rosa chinensis TaxID=74649 RepID=UPI000D08A5D6|nr:putative 4-hydroxy-4-methyl-2-oxoglutarate aldolase 3 [Rosa chinensis]
MIDSVPAPEVDHGYSYTTLTVEKICSIVNLKLKTREMYFFWKTLFEDIFKRYELTGIVNGSEPCPDRFLIHKNGNLTNQVNLAFDVWHEKDQKIITWIKSTLSEDVVLPLVTTGVIPSNSSCELWLSLRKRFAVAGVSAEYRRSLAAAALATTDICDANPARLESGDLRLLEPNFQRFGKWHAFSGRVLTLKVFEDNTLVIEALSRKGEGRVLVVDGGGSMRRAVTGGMLAKCAEIMGWAGIVVNGCVRDVDEINECEIGVRALATCPVRPIKGEDGSGQKHVDVNIGGTWIRDGEWLYADNDGILVSTTKLSI